VLAPPPSRLFYIQKGISREVREGAKGAKGVSWHPWSIHASLHVLAMVFGNAALPPVTLRASSPLRELRAKRFFDLCLRQRSKPLRLCVLLAAGKRRNLNQRLKCRIFFAILHLGSLTSSVRHPKVLGQNCRA
jgi:hypothetical protein